MIILCHVPLDVPSDFPLVGSRKRLVILTRPVVCKAVASLIGKPLRYNHAAFGSLSASCFKKPARLIGKVLDAAVTSRELIVCAEYVDSELPAAHCSWELTNVQLASQRETVWRIVGAEFAGFALVDRPAFKSSYVEVL